MLTFAYTAWTPDDQPIRGTIESPTQESARRQIAGLGLRLESIAATLPPAPAAAVRGEDFLAFNEQLAHLTTAGLPIERGLRLIADDMRRGRLRATVEAVASDVEAGASLPQALERHRGRFPPLYATLVDAGMCAGNLPGMLLNLGRHVELVQRLKQAVWRAVSYPLAVFIGLALVSIFIGAWVLPQMNAASAQVSHLSAPMWRRNRGSGGPWLGDLAVSVSSMLPWVLGAIAVVLLAFALLWLILRALGRDAALIDAVVLRLPLVGPAMRANLVARWCDAAALAVAGGMDLPRSLGLAADAVASPRLRADTAVLRSALERGGALTTAPSLSLLPPAVPATIDLAARAGSLHNALLTLGQMYQQQAESRLSALPILLTPLLLALLALVIVFNLLGMLVPLIRLIQSIA